MKKQKKTIRENNPVLNKEIQEALIHFLEYYPPKRLSKHLRKLLIEFLTCDGSTESIYLREILIDLEGLFNFLDVAEDEWKSNPLNS